jgi:predicted nucleic acid-binding protein
MKIVYALHNTTRLFLDTAPVIYYIEKYPQYFALMSALFDYVEQAGLTIVVSPVTLAESLIVPVREGLAEVEQKFLDLLLHSHNTTFIPLDEQRARQAVRFRTRYNLSLLDATQIATALDAQCEVLLTNDATFRRVTELRILMVDDLEV